MTEIKPASDYCQRWNGRRHSFRHTSEGGFDPARYSVERIDEPTAKRYIILNHYSGSYPSASQRFGLLDTGQLVGVMVLGVPVQTSVLTNVFPGLEAYVESLELSRFVLEDRCPANSESWFLARGFEMAAAAGVRGIVSFADPVPRVVGGRIIFPGHIGTIYQASNALYTGRGTVRTIKLLPTGEVFNERSAQKVRSQEKGAEYVEAKLVALGARPMRAGETPAAWLREALADAGARNLRHRGCHRYVFTIGETRRQRRSVEVAIPQGSYPKERDAA